MKQCHKQIRTAGRTYSIRQFILISVLPSGSSHLELVLGVVSGGTVGVIVLVVLLVGGALLALGVGVAGAAGDLSLRPGAYTRPLFSST
jgi:hypothetical protein